MYRVWELQVKRMYRIGTLHVKETYRALFAEQLTRTFEVLVLVGG